jgi:aryl-alcohol dehydrogenase-like predicted oxidoreductase
MRELVPRAEKIRQITGILAGDAVRFAQWSLKFILAHPAVSTVIPGARNPQQSEKNCGASVSERLPEVQVEAVRKMWREDPYLRGLRTGL